MDHDSDSNSASESELRLRAGAKTRTIHVDYLARVEGEGALYVKTRGDLVEDVQLRIFEPPRFFEAFLRGRLATEAPDLTARICGICPVAYQMSSTHAIEQALGIQITPDIRALRRLLYCGEWIESHGLHVYMLHAPDFLGKSDVVALAKDFPGLVRDGLELKKTGNEILRVLGGREIHPINIRVGGFYRLPTRAELLTLREPLLRARDQALATVRWVSGFPFPDVSRNYDFVSLWHPDEYPLCEGQIVSSSGLRIAARDFEAHFVEQHVAHSNALHAAKVSDGGAYLVGPLARYNLCGDKLPEIAKQAARDAKLPSRCQNPFQSIIVRAVELVFACDEALRVVEAYRPSGPAYVAAEPRDAEGAAATCAPRGLLYQRYKIRQDGTIAECKIVPPTSQNQRTIEDDLRTVVSQEIRRPKAELTARCEQTIRNHDPCISCATHFLRLEIEDDAKIQQNS
ncbi:MAG TPA: nickel-dependent hydrogenase large subunit [Pseudomonadota bacterium]|nr:nickel-dependent hydrogenase large subunit [Pseudomonadota bacterium]